MWGQTNLVTLNLYARHFVEEYELSKDVATDDQVRIFCQEKIPVDEPSILTKVDRLDSKSRGKLRGKFVKATFAKVSGIKGDYDSYIVLQAFYVRNKKLYLMSEAKSPIGEWITSLHLLCTSFFKILSNEIYYKAPAKLRLRAIVCTVAVPTVALMGVLMPFASYYFNRIVGDLDCWMNGFDNRMISVLSRSQRKAQSSRCFAIDLQPYAYLKGAMFDNIIYVNHLLPEKCEDEDFEQSSQRLVNYIFTKYKNMGVVVIRSCNTDTTSYNRLI